MVRDERKPIGIGQKRRARRSRGLAESEDAKVDLGFRARLFGGPPTVRPRNSEAVRVVDGKKDVAPTLLECDEPGKIRAVAVHAEDAFRQDHDDPVLGSGALEKPL